MLQQRDAGIPVFQRPPEEFLCHASDDQYEKSWTGIICALFYSGIARWVHNDQCFPNDIQKLETTHHWHIMPPTAACVGDVTALCCEYPAFHNQQKNDDIILTYFPQELPLYIIQLIHLLRRNT